MQIKELSLTTFKGTTRQTPLERLNLIIGPNGSGKTAHLLAPQFAVTGATPLGDRLEATEQLAGPDGCRVEVGLDDGFTWRRLLHRHHRDKKLSAEIQLVGQEEASIRAAQAVVTERVGNFAPMFDLGAFLGLSPDKRRDFVVALCSKHASVRDTLDELPLQMALEFLKIELGEGTVNLAWGKLGDDATLDEMKAVLDQLLSLLSAPQQKALLEAKLGIIGEVMAGVDVSEAIAAMLGKAKECANFSKRQHGESTQAARKLSDEKAALPIVSESLDALKQQLADLREKKETVIGQIENQQGRLTAKESLERDIAELAEKIGNEQKALELAEVSKPTDITEAENMESQAAAIEANNVEPVFDETIDDRRQEAQETCDRLHKEVNSLAHRAAEAQIKTDGIHNQIEQLEGSPWATALALVDDAIKEVTEGVTSDASLQSLSRLRAFIAEQAGGKALDEARNALPGVEKALADLRADCAAKEAAYREANDTWNAICKEELDARTLFNTQQARYKLQGEKRQDLLDSAKNIRNQIDAHQKGITDTQASLAKAEAAKIEKERDLGDLLSKGGHIPTDELEEHRDTITEAIKTLDEQIEAKNRFQALEHELTRCTAAAESEMVMHEVCKTLVLAIKAMREEMMVGLVAPLIDRMNHFLEGAVSNRQAYCELADAKGKAIFQLGWIVDGERKVALPALSGGETAILGAALLYALVMLADPPLKLLLLEVGAVDVDNFLSLLDGLEHVGPDVGNIIVATHMPFEGMALNHWNTVKLGRDGNGQN